jgi:hypothetical protein
VTSLRRMLGVLLACGCLAAPAAARPVVVDVVHTSTFDARGAVATQDALWVATRGGLERYARPALTERRVLSTLEGLDTPDVRDVGVDREGLWARTPGALCRPQGDRFACAPAPAAPDVPIRVGPEHRGFRQTGVLSLPEGTVVTTAGGGTWLRAAGELRITPESQLPGSFVTALAPREDALWIGTFNDGLARLSGETIVPVAAPARRINALLATDQGLYIGAAEGLFVTRDGGGHFERVDGVEQDGVNGLAADARFLWATTPGALWRLPLRERGVPRAFWRPAGARALQGVTLAGGALWLASEDRGLIRFDGAAAEAFDATRGLPTSWVLRVGGSDEAVYGATLRDGIVALGSGGASLGSVPAPDPWALFVGVDGSDVWVGTQGGAARVSGGRATRVQGLPDPRVHVIARHGARAYFGTELGLASALESKSRRMAAPSHGAGK